MISFRYHNTPVQLPDGASVAFELLNPLFGEKIAGSKVYNFDVLRTPAMSRLFGFPDLLESTNEQEVFPGVEMFLENHLWRRGAFRLKKVLPKRLQFTFHADAGELASQFAATSLRSLNLGTAAPDFSGVGYPQASHVFFPVQNPGFYADNANPDYAGVVNSFASGSFVQNGPNNTNTLVPFPFLLHIMNRAAQAMGFLGVRGSWTESQAARELVIYNTRDIMRMQGGVLMPENVMDFQNHVPDLPVGVFFRAVKNLFGLYMNINSQSRYIEIEPILEVMNRSAYYDLTRVSDKQVGKELAFRQGFTLSMAQDDNDALYKAFEGSPRQADSSLVVGTGQRAFRSEAGTLFMTDDAGMPQAGMPQAEQPGNAPAYEQAHEYGFRLLFYRGRINGIPSGYNATDGLRLGYTGPNGLYQQCWQAWLDRLSESIRVETGLRLSALDLINLDLSQKFRREHLAYFLEEVKANVSSRGTSVKASLIRTPL